MAKVLVTYLTDANVIREAIRREFRQVPTERTINELRARYLARKTRPEEAPANLHGGYYPGEAADSLAEINAIFLARLQDERSRGKLLAA